MLEVEELLSAPNELQRAHIAQDLLDTSAFFTWACKATRETLLGPLRGTVGFEQLLQFH